MNLVTVGATCEAEGHPSECTPVVSGTVQATSDASLSVNNASGTVSAVATTETADMHFDSHSHDYDGTCHQDESHDVDPTTTSSSLTLNKADGTSSPLYIVGDAVGTDPTSGGDINITDAGNNNSVSESP